MTMSTVDASDLPTLTPENIWSPAVSTTLFIKNALLTLKNDDFIDDEEDDDIFEENDEDDDPFDEDDEDDDPFEDEEDGEKEDEDFDLGLDEDEDGDGEKGR